MEVSDSAIRLLVGMLEERTGQQLTSGRRWRIETALAALLRARGFASLEELSGRLAGGREPALAQEVAEALLNHETSFFRDRAMFDLLAGHALPLLAERRRASRRLRLWSAGCSTGQEAYSLAMLFGEDPRWNGWSIDIVATDVSASAIERARSGVYSRFEVQRGLGVREMIRWFDQSGDSWRAAEALRRRVRFMVHNLLEPPPHPGDFDIILCRNVLLYFGAPVRARAFDRLASALAPDGWLLLGAAETVIGQTERLEADNERRGLYRLAPEAAPRLRSGTRGA